nr:hypothetical protein [Clostridium botulinum]
MKKNTVKLSSIDLKTINNKNNMHSKHSKKKSRPKNQVSIKNVRLYDILKKDQKVLFLILPNA